METLKQIKSIIRNPAYFEQIQTAVAQRNQDKIERALRKYLRKKQAEPFFQKIKAQLFSSGQKDPRKQLQSYLTDKLDQSQNQMVMYYLDQQSYSDCKNFLSEYLRFEQYLQVMPILDRICIQPSRIRAKGSSDGKMQLIQPKVPQNKQAEENKKKNKLFFQLSEQLRNPDIQSKIKQWLQKGQIKKVEKTLNQLLGLINAPTFIKEIRELFKEKENTPLENTIKISSKNGISFYQIPFQQRLEGVPQNDVLNLLVVGMTGVGKSTFLNSLVNYLLDVEMEDNFRYIISKDYFKNSTGMSSTDKVHVYGLRKQGRMKKSLRLIDIPGLGDTGGIKKDKQNMKEIRKKLTASVPYINQIIYIFKASEARVTKQTEFVISEVMGMFARDLQTSILFVLTFADNDEPTVLPCLYHSFGELIKKISNNYESQWYYKVNNSALLKKIDSENKIDQAFYRMGEYCMKKIMERIERSPQISMLNSITVMQYRQMLEQSINALDIEISRCFEKQQTIKSALNNIVIQTDLCKKYSNFKILVAEEKLEFIKTENNVTSCMNCKFSCHKKCTKVQNTLKARCMVMQNGFCKVCPQKCPWSAHINENYIVKRVQIQVEKTNKQIQQKFNIENNNKTKQQDILLSYIQQYSVAIVQVQQYIEDIKQKNYQLSQIELRKVNHIEIVQYIDMLIQNQRFSKKEGYLNKIKELKQFRVEHERLEKIFSNSEQDNLSGFESIMRERISTLIPNKEMAKKLIQKVLEALKKIKISKDDMKLAKQLQSPGQNIVGVKKNENPIKVKNNPESQNVQKPKENEVKNRASIIPPYLNVLDVIDYDDDDLYS